MPRFFTRCGWEGLENLPKDQPVLLCANHSSAVDPILLICAMRQDFPLRIMAKKQLMKIPVVGAFLRAIGVFGVDRGNSDIAAVKTSIQSLRDGWNLLVFPEGTRVKEPGSVDVKGGVGMMAIRSGVPLVPVFIGRDKRLFHRVSIIIGKPYDPVYTGPEGNGGGLSVQRRGDHASGLCAGGNPMAEVRVAKSAGFCYGVERAVKLAEETAREKGGCAMLGSIIHNVHVVAELEALGARQVDSVEEVRPGETVIIRSHGERKEVFDRLEQLGSVCVNATCPNVLRIQQLVAQADREGRIPLIIGEPRHPEVMGVASWSDRSVIFPGPEELEKWLLQEPSRQSLSLTAGGSDHLYPNNLGNFQRNFKKTVYKRKNL